MKIDRLAAIYNVWLDSIELLPYSIASIREHVDEIIIVYQNTSNYGELGNTREILDKMIPTIDKPVELVYFQPFSNQPASFNEKMKRNIGLDIARGKGCSHFLHMDCDEMYQDFGMLKKSFEQSGYQGSVVPLHTYFKKPVFQLAQDENYYVPFIHILRKGTTAGDGVYPFYVDPTRKISETDVVMLSGYMHHYSWVRRDIEMKIRNSSAKKNIEKSQLLADWKQAHVGMFVKDYNTHLIEVPNYFNIEL